jgi:ribose transport system substrate-binding protein
LKSPNWTEDGGYHAVSSWLRLTTSHSEPIAAVAAQNDFIAIGARRAFEEAKLLPPSSQLPFLGIDGLLRTGQAFVNRGSLAATIVVPPIAGPALEAVAQAISTHTKPPEVQLIPSYSYPSIDKLQPIAPMTHN